ncbi:MAG: DUF389 domain-containing protein [Bacteroidales bacterium]|nr:DUF389 domain-containing protein [Bacteroidales bacterium]
MRRLIVMLKRLGQLFNLDTEVENFDNIHQEILKGVSFRGTNLWILFFAIIVASVGLNMNSTAVIIGAMLISPLMGPINGMGYSIATYDMELFKKSIKNFSYAVGISLLASTAYFAISPISTAHSELLARTSPSIYDVLIALFGGLAGIVAISSKQKGNVIPGVAIATALMPPLCTAGYGLASGQLDFFLGAFYLFTINTVFIAIASVLISQILKFPIRTVVDPSQKKRINRWISIVIALVFIPSIYFGYLLVKKEQFVEEANKYITNVSTFEGNYLLSSEVNPSTKTITLVYGGLSLSNEQKEQISQKATQFNLDEPAIQIKQGLSFAGMDAKNMEVMQLREELNNLDRALRLKANQVDSLVKVGYLGQALLAEISAIYPAVKGCTYADTYRYTDSLSSPTALVLFETAPAQPLTIADKQTIRKWVSSRLDRDSVMVTFTDHS